MGVVHHFLLLFLGMNGARLTVAERLLEAIFLSSWPFCFSSEVAAKEQDGGNAGLAQLFSVSSLFSVTFSLVCLCFIAMGGALAFVQLSAWIFPGVVEPLSRTLMGPVSVSTGWSLLPLLAMGAMTFGLPYSFGPFVALHERKGFIEAFERSRFLTRDLRISIFLLHGFLFITLCVGFLMSNRIPNAPTLTNRVLESLVIVGTAGLASAVWDHAYRQALRLDVVPVGPAPVRGGRIHIPDSSLFMGETPPGSP